MEPLVHLILPALILLAFLPKYKKEVLLFSLFAILPDFDTYIPHFHRILFHNIFFILIIALSVYLISNKFNAILSSYYLLSHLILDIEYPGTAFLYPFYEYFIAFRIKIITTAGNLIPQFNFDIIITSVVESVKFTESTYFGNISVMFLVLLILSAIIFYYKKEVKK